MRSLDISCLRRLVTACEHDDENAPAPCEVQTIARTEFDSHLRHFTTDGLPVTEIAGFRKTQPGSDADLSAMILESVEPVLELLRLADGEHHNIVSIWIRLSSGVARGGVPRHGVSDHGQSPSGAAEFVLQAADDVGNGIVKAPADAVGHLLYRRQPLRELRIQGPRFAAAAS